MTKNLNAQYSWKKTGISAFENKISPITVEELVDVGGVENSIFSKTNVELIKQ